MEKVFAVSVTLVAAALEGLLAALVAEARVTTEKKKEETTTMSSYSFYPTLFYEMST